MTSSHSEGHKLASLSEQQLVDCSGRYGDHGCGGGIPGDAFAYVIANRGIDSERDYGYTSGNGRTHSCNVGKTRHYAAAFTSARNVPQLNEGQLLRAVAEQPVAVAIDAIDGGFRSYHRGVMGGKCGTQIDHSVLAVGFGTMVFPPPPPPAPTRQCTTGTHLLCYNYSSDKHPVLPVYEENVHDHVSRENCAADCSAVREHVEPLLVPLLVPTPTRTYPYWVPTHTENLREDAAGMLRDEYFVPVRKGDEATRQCHLGAVACGCCVLLTRALLMTSSQSERPT